MSGSNDQDNSGGPKPAQPKKRGKLIFIFAAVALGFMVFSNSGSDNDDAKDGKIGYGEFQKNIQKGNISKIKTRKIYGEASTEITGQFNDSGKPFKLSYDPNLYGRLLEVLPDVDGDKISDIPDQDGDGVRDVLEMESLPMKKPSVLGSIFISLLPMLLIIGVIIFFIRRAAKNQGNAVGGHGKSKAKMVKSDVRFSDVAGVAEAKEDLGDIVEFLKDPQKLKSAGGAVPKGVLMSGEPGTGKTLLAKAVAGEAGVPFFSASGSEFVEMFVGVGASRVRDMFAEAKANAPCIVFIDEIDAVGKRRGGLGGGSDSEREQTLNQLLVEMDGFGSEAGIIIIAATNRPDVLDPALTRPGRLDRGVNVGLPDVKAREQILKVHARKIRMNVNTDLAEIAKATPGFSGAQLAGAINEAALAAAKYYHPEIPYAEGEKPSPKPSVRQAHLVYGQERIIMGKEKRSAHLIDQDRERTAYHEAGHGAMVEYLRQHKGYEKKVHKITITPRSIPGVGEALGYMMPIRTTDSIHLNREDILSELKVTLAGRAAEEVVYGDNISTGASGDIQQAAAYTRRMITQWGMDDEISMMLCDENQRNGQALLDKIDDAVLKLTKEAYAETLQILKGNRKNMLDVPMESLMKHNTLSGDEFRQTLQGQPIENTESNFITYFEEQKTLLDARKEEERLAAVAKAAAEAEAQAQKEAAAQKEREARENDDDGDSGGNGDNGGDSGDIDGRDNNDDELPPPPPKNQPPSAHP